MTVSNLIKKFKKTSPEEDPIIIIPGFTDDLVSADAISLNEQATGDIYCLKEVVIERNGDLTGNIHSKSCVVNGKVSGDILSSDYIEIKTTAVIEGNLKSGSIQIEAGAVINGFISIEKKIKLPVIGKHLPGEIIIKQDVSKIIPPDIKPPVSEIVIPEVKEAIPFIKIDPTPEKTIETADQSPEKNNNTVSSSNSWW